MLCMRTYQGFVRAHFRETWPAAAIMLTGLVLLFGCAGRSRSSHTGGQAAPQTAEWVDLLKMVNPDVHAVAGRWTLEGGALAVDETPAARIAFPFNLPEEYDFLIEFEFSQPSGCAAQLLSQGNIPFTWSMNAGKPPRCRLEDISGHSVIGNPTLRLRSFEGGRRYTSFVSVRNDKVTCLIDDEVIVEYGTDYRPLSRNVKWDMPDQELPGVGAWNGPMTFYRVAIRPVVR